MKYISLKMITITILIFIPFLFSCSKPLPEIIYRFSGGAGEKISEQFIIEESGEIILLEYHSLTSQLRVQLYESNKSEPLYNQIWRANGDNLLNIKPGTYYLKVIVTSVPLAEIIEDTYWHIEVWDK